MSCTEERQGRRSLVEYALVEVGARDPVVKAGASPRTSENPACNDADGAGTGNGGDGVGSDGVNSGGVGRDGVVDSDGAGTVVGSGSDAVVSESGGGRHSSKSAPADVLLMLNTANTAQGSVLDWGQLLTSFTDCRP